MKSISFPKLFDYLELMTPRDRLEFTGNSVGRQYTEVLISVTGKQLLGQYLIQDDRQKPEDLFSEHIQGFSNYGTLEVRGLHAILERK